jgi:competence protein ComEC
VAAWRTPLAAAAFAAGLLAWPAVGAALPVAMWTAVAVLALAVGIAVAPRRRTRGHVLEEAGLLTRAEPRPADALLATDRPPGRGPPWVAAVLVALGVLVAGVAWGGVHQRRTEEAFLRSLAPASVTIEGSLREDPRPRTRGWSAIVDVSLVRWADGVARVHETVWVSAHDEPPSAVRGDRMRVDGLLRVPEDPGFAGSLLRRGVVAEISVREATRLGPSSNPVIRAAQAVRRVVAGSIRDLFPAREAGLLLGLALGDDTALDEAVERDFRATGLGHLLVVSGGNVAMVLAPVLALGLALRLGRWPRFVLALGTVAFFVVLTGAEPSVMRAGVMAGLALTGTLLQRPRSAASVLAGAVLALLVVDPALVWSVGFQLSVTATASMVALASPIAARLWFLPTPLALATGATAAAQLGVTPVLLYHFHEVPLATLVANVLAFPAVSPALLLGLSAAGAGLLLAPLGRLLAALATLPLRYLEVVADRLSTAPVPWITSGGGPIVLIVGLVVVALVAVRLRSGRPLPRRATLLALGLVLPAAVWGSAVRAGPPARLEVRFLDVGQGDAALIRSPAGATVLIDAGPDEEQVAMDLSALGVKRLDVAVATHPHADHVAGFPAVFGRLPVGLVLEPGCEEPSPSYASFLRAVEDEGLTVRHPRAGETLEVADLRLEVLGPPGCASGTASDANNDSLVIRASVGGDVVLFPGDAEVPAQQWLLDEGVSLEADVLKMPHHGGDTSVEAFFGAVGAELVVVSVGQPNDYGHPVPSVLEAVAATGARILRTDRLGDVVVTFDAEGLLLASAG